MPSPRRPRAAAARIAISALVVAHLGCATESLKHAPPNHVEPWTVSPDSDYVRPLRETSTTAAPPPPNVAYRPETKEERDDEQKNDAVPQNRVQLEAGHRYTLAELIDIAERHNPDTREAWEKARQAALSIGLAESKYLPELALEATGGYQRTPMPIPPTLIKAGFVTFISAEVVPKLAAKWLLFDFGQREAELHEAKAKSFVANVVFTEAHEKVVFAVTKSYFALAAARAGVGVARFAVTNAVQTQEISEAKRKQGVATVVDVAQAQRATAQARYDLVKAQGGERTAYSALVGSMGIDPNGTLDVADGADRPLPVTPGEDVRALIERALVSRPDVLAAFGKVRAAEANLDNARTAYGPTLEATASLSEIFAWWSMDSPYFRLTRPDVNAMLHFKWELFEGGARGVKVATARSEVSAARASLDGARAKAIEDVTRTYDQLQASLAEYRASAEVEAAARTALDAAVEAYRSGVGPLIDALTAANAASKSQLQREEARGSVLTSAAELAFALGSATRR
jgi:outer membrane protein TolC